MNKIVSNFYLIKVGGKPSYVGYTNRHIRTRFREHLKDKDFGDELVEIESLGSLEYDFTWDIELISRYAREVSDNENELIIEYGTKDTIWQKGTSGSLGGQTWTNVKYFVRANRDSPKFRGLSEEAILAYLEEGARVSKYIGNYVNHMNLPEAIYIGNFVGVMSLPSVRYMKDFVNHMNLPETRYMRHFVSHMNLPETRYISDFVNTMKLPEDRYIINFISNMNLPSVSYMKDFVNHMNLHEVVYMRNFVGNMSKLIDK